MKLNIKKCKECKKGCLVERTNKKDKTTFLGCTNYPKCTFTKRGGKNPSTSIAFDYYPELDYGDYFDTF